MNIDGKHAVKVSIDFGGESASIQLKPPVEWIAHYGLGFFDNRDELHYSMADGNGQYVIANQADRSDFSYTAMAMFTYPMWNQDGDIEWGPSAGLGIANSSISALAGVSMLVKTNFVVTFGVIFQESKVLKGVYSVGDNVGDTALDCTVLFDKTYKPTWGIVFGYRFEE